MIAGLLGIAAIGAAFLLSSCARNSSNLKTTNARDYNQREEIIGENEILDAGGLDEYLHVNMKPDGKFRIYNFFIEGCKNCEYMDDLAKKFQFNYRTVEYTKIDVATFEYLPIPDALPITIMQYSNCYKAQLLLGPADESNFRRMLFSLEQICVQGDYFEDNQQCPAFPPSTSFDNLQI